MRYGFKVVLLVPLVAVGYVLGWVLMGLRAGMQLASRHGSKV